MTGKRVKCQGKWKNLLITIAAAALVGCSNAEDDISIQAAKNGNIELVKSALDNGANVNAKYSDGWTALHQSALYGRKDVVELLITKGANINAKEGTDLLH